MRKPYIPSVGELEAFCACARVGTTTGAAREMGLTQSAVSRSISALEDRLGVSLFVRARQRLSLSDAGRSFLPEAGALLRALDQAATSVMAFGGQESVLRIAVLPSFGRSWLIPRLGAAQKALPGVSFDVAARLNRVDFEAEPFDLSIQRSPHQGGGTHHLHLAEEQLVAVAAPGLVAGGLPQDAALLKLPLLQQSTRPNLWPDWFREAGLDPRLALRGARFDHFDMVLDAAQAGLGLGLVPEIIARGALESGRLALASERRLATGEDYVLIYPERSLNLPGFARFRDWLSAEIGG
ncbi:LysR family transcriptional regulator [Pseudooceanicola sp. CBS1P-1]|uniref:LysR family transcriptional regulator n=1 Tax=Pseudooceanicola albus TaxID=2692189 RepID=A0A6L7GAB8_9RHOB|nr:MULTISPECIES: LysR substrate-binding domain-containing protein [Pseudooceanicola]MBT9386364.1 LysR family transcriptional regulator [Pseudooceanicola endophyticus]MXN20478.1 LysR family transcriptional regulator [Pseudooceanicola albus]